MDKDVLKALGELDSPNATFLSENTLSKIDSFIDTGSMVLNAIISGSLYKGIPKNRVTLLAGESKVGKTLFLMKIIANAQRAGLTPVVFDSENAFDADSAKRLGVDPSTVKYVPCSTLEQTRNNIFKFLTKVQEQGLYDKFFIGIDSLANMFSEMETKRMDKDSVATDMGTRARAMRSLMMTLTNMCSITRTTAVCTNHVYDDPNAKYPTLEKNMQGGKSVIFLPTVTVQLAKKPVKDDDGKTIDDETVVGQKNYSGIIIRALTVKNRIIRPYIEGEIYLSFASGLSKYYGLKKLLVELGIIKRNGTVYSIDDKSIGYYKNWRKDKNLWEEKLLPRLEERIHDLWSYNNLEDEDVPIENEDEDEE